MSEELDEEELWTCCEHCNHPDMLSGGSPWKDYHSTACNEGCEYFSVDDFWAELEKES